MKTKPKKGQIVRWNGRLYLIVKVQGDHFVQLHPPRQYGEGGAELWCDVGQLTLVAEPGLKLVIEEFTSRVEA